MVERITVDQVRAWLDERVISDVQEDSEGEAEYNLQVELSLLPLHVIKEEPTGPLRIVGRTAFDTERTATLVRDPQKRRDLLTRIGPVLAATPGFYTFLDEEGRRCEFDSVHTIQLEHRIYPEGVSRQSLMDGILSVATAMRYIQNMMAALLIPPEGGDAAIDSDDEGDSDTERGSDAESGDDSESDSDSERGDGAENDDAVSDDSESDQ
jgi:hypothetical protein